MRIVVFGATGLIGQGVLQQALADPEVEEVLVVVRRRIESSSPKLRQLVHEDFMDLEPLADELADLDACLWCLGTSSAGHDEASYTRITYELTMAAAEVLRRRSPGLCFCFVSGAGTDTNGRAMWARVKGRTEDALEAMGLGRVVLLRPGFIRPLPGVWPRDTLYRVMHPLAMGLYPLLRLLGGATSSVEIGKAMLAAARGMGDQERLGSKEINALARRYDARE